MAHHASSEFRIDDIDIFRFTAVFHPFSLADRMPQLREDMSEEGATRSRFHQGWRGEWEDLRMAR